MNYKAKIEKEKKGNNDDSHISYKFTCKRMT